MEMASRLICADSPGLQSLERHLPRGADMRYPITFGKRQHVFNGFPNLPGLRHGFLFVITLQLIGDVNQTAGVDDVIHAVGDAHLIKGFAMTRVVELIVRTATDDFTLQARQGLVINHAAQRAGSEDVAIYSVNCVQRNNFDAKFFTRLFANLGADIGADDGSACGGQTPGETHAHFAESLNADAQAFKCIGVQNI